MMQIISFAILIRLLFPTQVTEPSIANGPVDLANVITAVDADSLAAFVQPGAAPISNRTPRFNGLGVVREYDNPGSLGGFQLTIGIYADRKGAESAASATMPQMPIGGGGAADARWFFSARACHMFNDNAFVLLQFNDGWVGPSSPKRSIGEPEKQAMNAVASALQLGLARHGVKSDRSRLNLPRLLVESVIRSAYLDGRVDSPCGYKIVVRNEAEGDLLFGKGSWGLGAIRQLSAGRYEVIGGQDGVYGGMAIRAARPTGEVGVLDVEDLVQAADKVELTWTKLDMRRRPNTEAKRREEIDRLRSGQDDVGHQRNYCEHLAQYPTPECAPLFIEILYGARHPAVKQPALRGLAEVLKQDGLEHYRRIAADSAQPIGLRAEAVILVREFGTKEDIPLLRRIGQENLVDPENGTNLTTFAQSGVKRLEVKDRVVPGD